MFAQLAVIYAFLSFSALACTTKSVSGIDLRTGKLFSTENQGPKKGQVVIFLSAKCPCSKSHETSIQHLAQEFPEFSFVGIHSNKDEDEGMSAVHFKEAAFSFPIIQDREFKWANELGAMKTPHAYVIGPKGECWFNGGVDDTKDASKAKKFYLKQALLDLREGKEPEQKTARTLGCSIVR